MSGPKSFLVFAFLITLSAGTAHPQTPEPGPESPTATAGFVTGFVYDGETRLPVRFAEMNVVSLPPSAEVVPAKSQPVQSSVPQRGDRLASAISGMDGSFRLEVPEGDYLVGAVKPGYLSPSVAAAMDFSLSEDQLRSVLASLPQVHVGAGQTANVSLTMHRGAVISGRMKYADGSPVIDAIFGCDTVDSVLRLESLLRPENRGKIASPLQRALQSLSSSQHVTQRLPATDDEGRFRIFGLAPGKYIVSTMISMDHNSERVVMNDGSNPQPIGREHLYPEIISVYAPATFRRKDARVFEIRGDEQIADADLTIDPNGLYTLRGRVLVASDHHAPRTSILLKEEGAHDAPRFSQIEDDGTFQVNYLPPSNYILQVTSNEVLAPAESNSQLVEYKTVELSVLVSDHDVLLDDVLVVPLKPGEKNPDFAIF